MTNPIPLSIVLLGASGAVGGEVLKTLLTMPEVSRIAVFTRRSLDGPLNSKITQHVVDVLNPASYQAHLKNHDIAICTLGVGQPTKASQEEFTRIDKQAVLDFANACKTAGMQHFSLLGAIAADAKSRSFYLRSKGELRDAIAAMGFERFSVFQPAMILTSQNRYGFSQAVMLALWPIVSPLMIGSLNKFRGNRVEDLGRAMAQNTVNPGKGLEVLHWADIEKLAKNRHTA
jgi:uncharacterized protein YbjT (DUF2867 family)